MLQAEKKQNLKESVGRLTWSQV